MGMLKSAGSAVGGAGMSFVKGMVGQGDPAGSISGSVGQLVGGALGTGGASTGSMAGMAGQFIGGAMGTAGGQDGSFGAGLGQQAAGALGWSQPGAEGSEGGAAQWQGDAQQPSFTEQLPGLVGSLTGQTRMKGCWKRAYYRKMGEIPSLCGEGQTRSGLWCF